MKITAVHVPERLAAAAGLGEIDMDRLGQLVLVAGRNGSGKTRLLRVVTAAFSTTRDEVPNYSNDPDIERIRASMAKQASGHGSGPNSPAIPPHARNEVIRKLQLLKVSGNTREGHIIPFVPKSHGLQDPQALTDTVRQNKSEQASQIGIAEFHQVVLPKIQTLQNRQWNVTHPAFEGEEEQKQLICAEYENLQSIIQELLGTRLQRDQDGVVTIFGFPAGKAMLSDGQKVLLQLAVAIHCQGGKLSETVLVMDEPENHLHPAAIIDVIEKLRKKLTNGQIWIATHSVSILAHFARECSLWYIDNGAVRSAGKTQELGKKRDV